MWSGVTSGGYWNADGRWVVLRHDGKAVGGYWDGARWVNVDGSKAAEGHAPAGFSDWVSEWVNEAAESLWDDENDGLYLPSLDDVREACRMVVEARSLLGLSTGP